MIRCTKRKFDLTIQSNSLLLKLKNLLNPVWHRVLELLYEVLLVSLLGFYQNLEGNKIIITHASKVILNRVKNSRLSCLLGFFLFHFANLVQNLFWQQSMQTLKSCQIIKCACNVCGNLVSSLLLCTRYIIWKTLFACLKISSCPIGTITSILLEKEALQKSVDTICHRGFTYKKGSSSSTPKICTEYRKHC